MSLVSPDPFDVLRAVKAAREAQPITEAEIVSPEGVSPRRVDVPCGVVHPCFVPWIAELLGIAPADVDSVMEWEAELKWSLADKLDYHVEPREPGPGHEGCGVGAIASALRSLPDSPLARRLRGMGISPSDLVLHCLPVPAGHHRPNPPSPNGNPIVSAQNAAWRHLFREIKKLEWFRLPGMAAWQASSVQRAFLYLLDRIAGRPLRFTPTKEVPTDRPAPPEMAIAPPRFSEMAEPPCRLSRAVFVADGVLLRFSNALVHISLPEPPQGTARFTLHRLGACRLSAVSSDGWRVLFLSGVNPRASVYDVSTRGFVRSLAGLPDTVVLGACCTVELLDLTERTTCCLPGPPVDSPVGCETTPGGDYVWLDLTPPSDDIGIVSVKSGEAVFQPWPHHAIEGIAFDDETEGHDDAPRALARMPDGRFRLLWDRFLFTGSGLSMEIEEDYEAACFDQAGSRLLLARADSFRVLSLDADGVVTRERKWDLTPVRRHLSWDPIKTPKIERFSEEEVMRAVGTIGSLAASDPAEVLKDFETTLRFRDIDGAEEYGAVGLSEAEAADLVSRARVANPPDRLDRC